MYIQGLIRMVMLCTVVGCVPTSHTESLCPNLYEEGGIVRGDTTKRALSLIFTGHEFADGGKWVIDVLRENRVKASFFFTGDFYRNAEFAPIISTLQQEGHFLGAHSDKHLLYCSWNDRDSLYVNQQEFIQDVEDNYREMERFGIKKHNAPFFMPPYEWYNTQISEWTTDLGLQLINYSSGTRSNADYMIPTDPNYVSSQEIYDSILHMEEEQNLNGFLLLVHIGVDPARVDKFYFRLEELIIELKKRGYEWVSLDQNISACS